MGPQVQKAPTGAVSKDGRESQKRPVLLVLVPGAFLYPKDYGAFKKALETVSNELYRQRGIAVTLGIASPDWPKVDPANFNQSMDVVNEAIEETIAMVQSLEDSGFEIEKNVFGRYENVVVALHSVSALAAGLFPLHKAKHLILLGSNLVHASGLWPSLDTYPLSSLSIYGDLDGQSHAAKAAIAMCASRHKDCMRRHYFCMIPNCNHASFSNGVRNTVRGDIAITSPDVRLEDTAHAICNTIAQFLASEYAQSGEAREFLNSETEKTWKTLSPYLRELGRLPSDYDCSTSSISRSDGELERVLSYAAGREAATMASTSPELLSHPGELGRAEEFAIRAQQLILQPILGHTKCNIKVTAQVHTSQKNFMYSKARMCRGKSSHHISVQCISNVQVQGTEFSMVSPFYALKLKSLKQVCIMLQHDVADDTETICEKLFNSSWKRAFDASANHIRERFTERGQPLICKEIHPSRAPDWVTSRPVLTPGCLDEHPEAENSKSNAILLHGYVRRLMMNSVENNVGGGEGIEGLYGSITGANMERILQCMEKTTGLCGTKHSVLMDVGSGLCRPLLHAMATNRATSCVGVEVDSVKCLKAEAFCSQIQKNMRKKEMLSGSDWNIDIVCSGIESLDTLGSVTHVYTFWEGVPVEARAGLGRLFRESTRATTISVVQRAIRCGNPAEFLDDEYGFGPLRMVDSFRVSMSGSGRSFMAYIFVKKEPNFIKAMFHEENVRRISGRKRPSSEDPECKKAATERRTRI